jgi:hypothetical protein
MLFNELHLNHFNRCWCTTIDITDHLSWNLVKESFFICLHPRVLLLLHECETHHRAKPLEFLNLWLFGLRRGITKSDLQSWQDCMDIETFWITAILYDVGDGARSQLSMCR